MVMKWMIIVFSLCIVISSCCLNDTSSDINSGSLPDAANGSGYSFKLDVDLGTCGSKSYSLTGDIPSGLGLFGCCTLNGTISDTLRSYTFTYRISEDCEYCESKYNYSYPDDSYDSYECECYRKKRTSERTFTLTVN